MRVRNLFGAFSALGTGRRPLAAATSMTVIAAAFSLGAAPAASADTSSIDFETPNYHVGDINGQDGWSKTGAYDVAVVDATPYGHPTFGGQALRMSNSTTSGGFGDQTFSKSLANEAGETTAENASMSGGTRQPTFNASFDFASTQLTAQDDMYMSVSPDRGDGARMSYLRFEDQADGIHVFFDDYRDVAPHGSVSIADGCGAGDDFTDIDIATINRSGVHNIRFHMKFMDGPGNDVVKIYIDGGAPVITGTSWEDYFRYCEATNTSRTVDSLLFREGGDEGLTHPTNQSKGFLVDNLNLTSGPIAPSLGECLVSISGTNPVIYTLLADCVTNQTIIVPQGANSAGSVFDGNSHSITAVDPTGDHFRGAVIQAQAGTHGITIQNLTVTASNLADVCDAGNDRLDGILFDGVGGFVTHNTVTGIKQGTGSGCQEGDGINVQNTAISTPKPGVTVTGNTVSDYQKTGIRASGSVSATINSNVVTGVGPVNYIAQNGIQVSFGATAVVKMNSSSGNNYTPASYVACGFLIYQAKGVSASSNHFFNNERNQCNFGKGGGTFKP
jgi:hypothetical protein